MTLPSLEFPFHQLVQAGSVEKLKKAAADAETVFTAQGARAANQLLIDAIGLSVAMNVNEAYCKEMLSYNLGIIHANLGNHARAAACINESTVLPTSGDNLVFSDQVRISLQIHEHQQRAYGRGMPGILLSSMPRSASAFLSQTIAEFLDIPIIRVSAGSFANYGIIPRWLNGFTPGGGILHDHFGASEYNLAVMRASEVREVFVMVRDPRAAALSYGELDVFEKSRPPTEDFGHVIFDYYSTNYVPWLKAWVDAEKSQKDWLKIHWISSANVRADVVGEMESIFGRLRGLYPALPRVGRPGKAGFRAKSIFDRLRENSSQSDVKKTRAPTIRANMRHGDDDRWRSVIPVRFHRPMWNELGDEIADRFSFRRDG